MLETISLVLVWVSTRAFLWIALGIAWFAWRQLRQAPPTLLGILLLPTLFISSLAIHFLISKPLFIDLPKQQQYLAEHGIPTKGCIYSVQDTSVYVNRMPMLKITLDYHFKGQDYRTELKQITPHSALAEIRRGECFLLLVDPEDPTSIRFH